MGNQWSCASHSHQEEKLASWYQQWRVANRPPGCKLYVWRMTTLDSLRSQSVTPAPVTDVCSDAERTQRLTPTDVVARGSFNQGTDDSDNEPLVPVRVRLAEVPKRKRRRVTGRMTKQVELECAPPLTVTPGEDAAETGILPWPVGKAFGHTCSDTEPLVPGHLQCPASLRGPDP